MLFPPWMSETFKVIKTLVESFFSDHCEHRRQRYNPRTRGEIVGAFGI